MLMLCPFGPCQQLQFIIVVVPASGMLHFGISAERFSTSHVDSDTHALNSFHLIASIHLKRLGRCRMLADLVTAELARTGEGLLKRPFSAEDQAIVDADLLEPVLPVRLLNLSCPGHCTNFTWPPSPPLLHVSAHRWTA